MIILDLKYSDNLELLFPGKNKRNVMKKISQKVINFNDSYKKFGQFMPWDVKETEIKIKEILVRK